MPSLVALDPLSLFLPFSLFLLAFLPTFVLSFHSSFFPSVILASFNHALIDSLIPLALPTIWLLLGVVVKFLQSWPPNHGQAKHRRIEGILSPMKKVFDRIE